MKRKKLEYHSICDRGEKCGLRQFFFSSSTWVFSTWGKFQYIIRMDFCPDMWVILGAHYDPPGRWKKVSENKANLGNLLREEQEQDFKGYIKVRADWLKLCSKAVSFLIYALRTGNYSRNFILTGQVLSALGLKTYVSAFTCVHDGKRVSPVHRLPHRLSVDVVGPYSSAWHVSTVI